MYHRIIFRNLETQQPIATCNNATEVAVGIFLGEFISDRNLLYFLNNLPLNVRSVYLCKYWLQQVSDDVLFETFTALNSKMISLQFRFAGHQTMGIDMAISSQTFGNNILNLSNLRLDLVPLEELLQLIRNTSTLKNKLILNNNHLYRFGSQGFSSILAVIPRHVLAVEINGNSLYLLGIDLGHAVHTLHRGVLVLIMENNGLSLLSLKSFLSLLKYMPRNLFHLGIGHNNLFSYGYKGFHTILFALHPHLGALDIVGNHLDWFEQNNWRKLVKLFPREMTHLNVEPELEAIMIQNQISPYFEHPKLPEVPAPPEEPSKVPPPRNIDKLVLQPIIPRTRFLESKLSGVIAALEKQEMSFAYFVGGLILVGRVKMDYEQRVSMAKDENYKELRQHAAVHFFVLASANPFLRPYVDTWLWYMKTNFKIPSLIHHLSALAVPPPHPEVAKLSPRMRKTRLPFFKTDIPNETQFHRPKTEEVEQSQATFS